ncbi:hypothetical protein JQM68_08030 [Oscillibacter valericigenes]|uniref:hypothetical protein n=1 Tax=Oscillibacter valericigenes TaxID=351091 RepID=UPI001F45AEDC|nr:hypothetical protein [Oscillibacter valericigenes]MCF2617147.1 hypothetical protein [Oscillibacter valericigenes]
MDILCPIHHKQLTIEHKRLSFHGNTLPVVIGCCPLCRTRYINRVLMAGIKAFSLDGIRYELLSDLISAFPIDYEKEKRLRIENELKEAHEEKKKVKFKKQQEAMKQKKVAEVATLKKALSANPYMVYHPAFLRICDKYPDVCPYDSEPLVFVQRPMKHGYSGKPGWCCLYCSRLYWLKTEKEKYDKEQVAQAISKRKEFPKNARTAKQTQAAASKLPNETMQATCLDLPSSFSGQFPDLILQAKIRTQKRGLAPGCVSIVSNEKVQSAKNGIYWVGRALSSAILAAVQTKHKEFLYKEERYQIIEYRSFADTPKYLNIISRFCNPSSPQPVYIFAQKNIQHYNNENYETVTAMIPCSNTNYPIPLTVYYERSTHMYFMNDATYSSARQRYGLPYLRLHLATLLGTSTSGFGELKQHSELNLLGYSVSRLDGLDTAQRRALLKEIMNSGALTKAEIMNHLEWLINTRSSQPNMINAVGEWKSDLAYIANYDVSSQRRVWVNQFKSRFF